MIVPFIIGVEVGIILFYLITPEQECVKCSLREIVDKVEETIEAIEEEIPSINGEDEYDKEITQELEIKEDNYWFNVHKKVN